MFATSIYHNEDKRRERMTFKKLLSKFLSCGTCNWWAQHFQIGWKAISATREFYFKMCF